MSRWNQPICERDWIVRYGSVEDGTTDNQRAIRKPVRVRDSLVECCSFCGQATIFGAYVRADPASVPYPPAEESA